MGGGGGAKGRVRRRLGRACVCARCLKTNRTLSTVLLECTLAAHYPLPQPPSTARFLLPARTLSARCPIPQNEQKCQQEIFKLLELRTPGESIVQTVLRIALTPLPWQDTPSLHAILHRMEFAAERANEASDVQVQPPATSCVWPCRQTSIQRKMLCTRCIEMH